MAIMEAFLSGSVVSLRQPDLQKDVLEGEWHSWFNDQEVTKFLSHGVWPVTREQERDIVAGDLKDPCTLLLSIEDNSTRKHIGVIALKHIDHVSRIAEIRIVMGHERPRGGALEAMALMTKHAFDRLNLYTLFAGQHEGLWKWVNSLSLIGYRVNGFMPNMGWRDGAPYSIFQVSVSAPDFYALQTKRGGNILSENLNDLMKQRSSTNLASKLRPLLANL